MKQLNFSLIFLFFSALVIGQEIVLQNPDKLKPETQISNIITADIDQDGTIDSLYYDYDKQAIICLLSSHLFDKIKLDFPNKLYGSIVVFSVYEGGINISMSHMRSFEDISYGYEVKSGHFRLEAYSHENLGSASNDGSGIYSIDFTTGHYIANWNYYNMEADSLIPLPTIELYIDVPPIYWDDPLDGVPGYDLFDSYKSAYTPTYTDTMQFVAFNYDYDFPIFIGEKENEKYAMPAQSDSDSIFKGDTIVASIETVIYHEPGDNSYRAATMITHIDKISSGKLSFFIKNNKKPIKYTGIHTEYWRYEYRAPNDFMYFLTHTTNSDILHELYTPGELEVNFSACSGPFGQDNCLSANILNHHKGKIQIISRLILVFDGDDTFYYLFDDYSQEYVSIEI